MKDTFSLLFINIQTYTQYNVQKVHTN